MEPFLGSLLLFAGNFAPRGWAFCNGQLMPIAQNTALFSLLGTTYGGDGVTTFAVPDLRGRAPIHWGSAPGLSNYTIGEASGVESVTLTVSNLPPHNHPYLAGTGTGAPLPDNNSLGTPAANIYDGKNAPTQLMNPAVVGMTGSGVPVENRSPFLTLTWIIATEGIYPSRS